MNSAYNQILAKHEDSGIVTLRQHLEDVAQAVVVIARNMRMDENLARKGAWLHDIGKASPLFQQTLKHGYARPPGFVFRHEIASLFFLSLVEEEERLPVIEMITAHHKSLFRNDPKNKGLLDLDENTECFDIHSKKFNEWSETAVGILSELGVETHDINIEEAQENYNFAVDTCWAFKNGCSQWKGLLMAADHYASALTDQTEINIDKLFIKPDLSFYQRRNELYPLSLIPSDDPRPHTLVTAPTGAGKTDFLLRRCCGRVFYTLPFQASINAMYDRIKTDLNDTDAQIYLLHAASNLVVEDGALEEIILQRHIGASIKVLTPHQMSSIVFGIKGYEAMAADLQDCDIILDEIHTYSDTIQSIVLRIIEILLALNCRIHIGTATMPSALYEKVLLLLGGRENAYEVRLPDKTLETFNRHIIYKVEDFNQCEDLLADAIERRQKILIVCNQVKRAQQLYMRLSDVYSDIQRMLIHSRFKRGDRQRLEQQLKNKFNSLSEACIVVSTQVVEVSLDISFDLMITECAPIDALIQRFGRINRKRSTATIGKYKPIYVLEPPADEKEALPYSLQVLQLSYNALPNGDLLCETDVQQMLDAVYPEINLTNIDYSGAIYVYGKWQLKKLCHYSKSALLDVLDIESAICITQADRDDYKINTAIEKARVEIPVSYKSITFRRLEKSESGHRPYIIPDKAYSDELGLQMDYAKPEYYHTFEIL